MSIRWLEHAPTGARYLSEPAGSSLPAPRRNEAVLLLQVYALAMLVIPSDVVVSAVGATGHAGGLVATVALALWAGSTLFGLHDPSATRYPPRLALGVVWAVSLGSYAVMDLSQRTSAELLGADRWLLKLAAVSGVVLVAAEWLRDELDVRRVLRAATWGGAVCGSVAALQFWASLDLARYLRMVPGFTLNADNVAIQTRAALNRAAGTAIHPIELGVVAAMLLPLAVYLAIHDTDRPAWRRWVLAGLVSLGVPASVSRSALLAVTVSVGIFVVLLPALHRLAALTVAPVAVALVVTAAPGLATTLRAFVVAGPSEPSIATRLSDYAFVEERVAQRPWLGQGGGTYFPRDTFEILDNQYLTSAVEQGLVGVVAIAVFYFGLPVAAALIARRHTSDPGLRTLLAALGAAAASGAVSSVAFDSLSFPMFTGVHALVVGLIGTCWLLVRSREAQVVPS